jgi:hypothetical protein
MPRSAKKNLLKRFFSVLGPGLVTGAADNDPSGIATYSIVGAQLGMSLLWTAFVTWPLMGFVQLICARIGMVTGRGLAGALRQICPRWLLFIAAAALLGANIVTIGADLAGMSDAGQMLTGINSHFLTIFFGVGITLATIYFRYYQIASIFEMAHPRSFCLRHYRLHTQTKLGKRFVLHIHSILASRTQLVAKSRCGSRHHHQPLLIFLAGFPGSGRGESDGKANANFAGRGN